MENGLGLLVEFGHNPHGVCAWNGIWRHSPHPSVVCMAVLSVVCSAFFSLLAAVWRAVMCAANSRGILVALVMDPFS